MERTDELKERIRQQPLNDRLEESRRRIGDMCSKGRCPKMTIPVQHDDDDFYINTTLADAQATIAALTKDKADAQDANTLLRRELAKLRETYDEECRMNEGIHDQLTQRTAERDTARRRVDELEAREVDVVMLREDLEQRTAELGRVRGERDNLMTCQCEGCDQSLEGSAYCERCLEKLRTLVLALPKVEGEITQDRYYQVMNDSANDETMKALLQHRQGMEG